MINVLKVLIVFFGFKLICAQISPVVETNVGKIRGSIMKTEKGSEFLGFRGIRYAEAPIGEKRFKAPIAIKKWPGVIDATHDGFMCPQIGKPINMMSEDCLILNVYTKSLTEKKSVIIYIPGGANIYGGSHSIETAGPEYLMESDIVLVTISFRLGALGFLSTRTKEAPGNVGYLDQVMAFEWVHDHITKFGGNPKSVTILGMSSGSFAVTLHLASPLSQGLFHKAIAMSGSAIADLHFDNLQCTQKLARETSCPIYNPKDVVSCLRKLPWQTIVGVVDSWKFYNLTDMKWSYEIDGNFLTKSPTVTFAEGNFSKVPILTGITKDEFTYMIYSQENNSGLLNDINMNFEKYAPEFFTHIFDETKIKKLRNFYLGNEAIDKENLRKFGEIFSDAIIINAINRLIQLARQYVDVFYYRFDYLGRYGIFENWNRKPLGVNHGDDLQYVIKRKYLRQTIKLYDPEWFMVERMISGKHRWLKMAAFQ
ncbi:juvenile hormone esterase-like [Episyrphus balteatus]|uniref:juvenile hormone esterase-like n=1 Tax=Episyrphus balteatus TaxID=286459 RepID=UPI002486A3DF|nr:juvenile hormone esterase-like [Episyrphus balteatus]